MASYGYIAERGWTPYSSSTYGYDFALAPTEAPSQYLSPYESGEPEFVEYKSSSYCVDDSFETAQLNYSVYTRSDPIEYRSSHNYYEYPVYPSGINYSEPKLLKYEPPPYDQCYFPCETKFTISYSKVEEFNEPEFEEYDPTPYGGGYDPASTYGEPLPPSETTCYPRSVPRSDAISLESFSFASIPSPYGKEDDLPTKPPNGNKPMDTKIEGTETEVGNGEKVTSDGADVEIVEPSDVIEGDDPRDQNGFENGSRGDYGYGSEREMSKMLPYGAGLETLDICESIFGYWPCLAKIEQQQRRKCSEALGQERRDPWESAADYLFGSPIVYDYEYHHHRHHHYQQQDHYEYYKNSWLE